jgi:hypothetical protein
MVGAIASLTAGPAEASARALGAIDTGPSDELGDTETADAISTIKPVRQRMDATDKRYARLERCGFMICFSLVSMLIQPTQRLDDWVILNTCATGSL